MYFHYQDGELHAEQVALRQIAEQVGTPCYVYSRAALTAQWHGLNDAFDDYPHQIYYAVKANSNIAVLDVLAGLGSGFDIVSAGELHRVLAAGGTADKVVFSGVAKSVADLEYAINAGVHCINIESEAELERVQQVAAELGRRVAIALRINPDVDPQTHPYISTGLAEAKFGIRMQDALRCYLHAGELPNLDILGVACHIGSQITSTRPFVDALNRVLGFERELRQNGVTLAQLDLGGGLGIPYREESPPSAADYVTALLTQLRAHDVRLPIGIEPGRFIAGNSGVLLTRVEYLKSTPSKNFAVVDAGMNDLLRPALYQAEHHIVNLREDSAAALNYEVVGPVCESADVLSHASELALLQNDLLAVKSAGAYGFGMSSNYNSRPRAAEVMVDGDKFKVIRKRETLDDLLIGEVRAS